MSKRVTNLCLSALFTALLTVGSWISIPFAVPFTLQTLVLYIALWLLPPSYTLATVSSYLFLGALGLPVFAGFQGGFGVLIGPFGGFLWGFLLMGLIHLAVRPRTTARSMLCLTAETLACYAVGALWYAACFSWTAGGLMTAFSTAVLPFILPDTAKLLAAWQLSKRLEKHLPRH